MECRGAYPSAGLNTRQRQLRSCQHSAIDLRLEAIARQAGRTTSRVAINRERRQGGVEHIMFTVGDIGAIPVLSALAQAELERLARTSPDIRQPL